MLDISDIPQVDLGSPGPAATLLAQQIWQVIRTNALALALATTGVGSVLAVDEAGVNLVRSAIHYANVYDHGAVGDGVANDTAAAQAALATGKWVMFINGTFLVDGLTISQRRRIIVDSSATVKLRSIVDADTAVFTLTTGSNGSYVGGGGIIDGNRDALLGTYLALPHSPQYGGTSYVIQSEFDGVRVEPGADVIIENLTIQNCFTHGVCHRGGDNPTIRNITVKNCGKVLNAQRFKNGVIEDVRGINIGNRTATASIPFWQYGFEIRDLSHVFIRNLSIDGYVPALKDTLGNVIGDPYPAVAIFERMESCTIDGIDGGDYVYNTADATAAFAVYIASGAGFHNCTIKNIRGKGYYWGEEYSTAEGCHFGESLIYNTYGNDADGGFANSAGFRLRANGIYTGDGVNPSNDARAISTGRNNIVTGKRIFGFKFGMKILGGQNLIVGNVCHGARESGIQVAVGEANTTTFPGATALKIYRMLLANNDCRFNGLAGIDVRDGDNLLIDGNILDNNGQRTAVVNDAPGLRLAAGNSRTNVAITNGSMSDTQSFTVTGGVSFVPGASDANNRMSVLLTDVSRLGVGQNIKIVNGTGSGDITARIIDLTMDTAVVQSSAPVIYSETSNLAALTGTWTINSGTNTLTGSGGAATTEIVAPCYVKIGSEYLRVSKVLTDNSILTYSNATTHTAASMSKLRCDLSGIPSQSRPLYISSNASNVSWSNVTMQGNLVNAEKFDAITSLADGQIFRTEFDVAVTTTGVDTPIGPQYSLSDGVFLREMSVIVTQDITGLTGANMKIGYGYSSGYVDVKLAVGITKNSKARGLVPPANWITPDNILPTCRFYGGSDNTPDGGRTKGTCVWQKYAAPLYANVP